MPDNVLSVPFGKLHRTGHAASLQALQVPQLWQQGLTGEGVGVAIIDSGCAPHPDLGQRLEGFHDTWEGKTQAYDVNHHGTAVATILAGSGQGLNHELRGVAPQARLVAVRVTDEEGAVESYEVAKALDWVRQNRERYNIQVVNLSLGLEDEGLLKVTEKVRQLRQEGLLVLTSAGNEGPRERRLTEFKGSPDLFTVASGDTHGTADPGDDSVSPTSTRAKPGSPKNPDFTVPGLDLVAGDPQGGYVRFRDGGTSLATALASGVMALWKQEFPNLTYEQAQQAIQATARPLQGVQANAQGVGLLQALTGLEYLRRHHSPKTA